VRNLLRAIPPNSAYVFRYTDTKLDPYNATEGFWHSHIGALGGYSAELAITPHTGWLLIKPRRKQGTADITDLTKSPVVQWQHNNFIALIILMSFIVPTVIPWLGWGDARGGYVYAALLRLSFVHHSTFCVNSLAHWLGDSPFDDKHTPKDHLITALATIGEGYHNFHHQACTVLYPHRFF
jgi:stearoyl-CoA desaturase (delta-9 desaturase)